MGRAVYSLAAFICSPRRRRFRASRADNFAGWRGAPAPANLVALHACGWRFACRHDGGDDDGRDDVMTARGRLRKLDTQTIVDNRTRDSEAESAVGRVLQRIPQLDDMTYSFVAGVLLVIGPLHEDVMQRPSSRPSL